MPLKCGDLRRWADKLSGPRKPGWWARSFARNAVYPSAANRVNCNPDVCALYSGRGHNCSVSDRTGRRSTEWKESCIHIHWYRNPCNNTTTPPMQCPGVFNALPARSIVSKRRTWPCIVANRICDHRIRRHNAHPEGTGIGFSNRRPLRVSESKTLAT